MRALRTSLLGATVILMTGCAFLPPPAWVTDREALNP